MAATLNNVYVVRYCDFQLSKAQEKFGHKVLIFKLPCCQGQLALFSKGDCMNRSGHVIQESDSCSLP